MKPIFSLLSMTAVAGMLALLPGCAMPRFRETSASAAAFPSPGPDWKTSLGQLRYATPQRAVIGEAVVSRDPAGGRQGDFQLDFTAGPGVPLMSLRVSGDRARAEGLFARGSWSGNPARAGRLGSWMTLREVFAALDAAPAAHSAAGASPHWTARSEPEGKGHRVTVEYPATRERFVFVFGR